MRKNCSVCGKEVETKDGKFSLIGLQIIVSKDAIWNSDKADWDEDKKQFVQKQLGNYEIGKEYNICFECWLKSMGVK